MKKELNKGVVYGIVAVVVVIVLVLGWKMLAVGPIETIHPDKEQTKALSKLHNDSAKSTQEEQMRLYKQSHGGQ